MKHFIYKPLLLLALLWGITGVLFLTGTIQLPTFFFAVFGVLAFNCLASLFPVYLAHRLHANPVRGYLLGILPRLLLVAVGLALLLSRHPYPVYLVVACLMAFALFQGIEVRQLIIDRKLFEVKT